MKRFLVDLDVVLDVLLDRAPHAEASAALWAAIETGSAEGWIAGHGLPTVFYLVSRQRDRETAHRVVRDLLTIFRIAPVGEDVIRRAVTLEFPDFEDAVSAAAAEAVDCHAIVTRNVSDFERSPVDSVEPLLALALLDVEVHEPAASYSAD